MELKDHSYKGLSEVLKRLWTVQKVQQEWLEKLFEKFKNSRTRRMVYSNEHFYYPVVLWIKRAFHRRSTHFDLIHVWLVTQPTTVIFAGWICWHRLVQSADKSSADGSWSVRVYHAYHETIGSFTAIIFQNSWFCGLMDKALLFESKDCGFESRQNRFSFSHETLCNIPVHVSTSLSKTFRFG
jgi:hypothetical protein